MQSLGWVTFRQRDRTLHVMPLLDVVDHELSDDCVCGPDTVPVERDDGSIGFFFTHQSLDGREANE